MSIEQDLVRLIGRDKTLALEQAFGGRRKYFAGRPKPESDIVRVIGMDAALTLGRAWGGLQAYIPRTLALMERNRAILQEVLQGHSKQTVAERYGLVPRSVRWICQGLDRPRAGLLCRRLRIMTQEPHERYGRPDEPDGTGTGGHAPPASGAGGNTASHQYAGEHRDPSAGASGNHQL